MTNRPHISRGRFLESAALGAGALAFGGTRTLAEHVLGASLPDPAQSSIDHVVLVMISCVDPRFIEELTGTTSDDHPHADIRNGQAFLAQIYDAVTRPSVETDGARDQRRRRSHLSAPVRGLPIVWNVGIQPSRA